MTQRKKRIDPDDPLKELDKLMRKLVPEQGVVARRNARSSVCAELRRVRAYIDQAYPSTTPKKQRRKRKTGQAKVNALVKEGWEGVGSDTVAELAKAGILPKEIKVMELRSRTSGGVEKKYERIWTLVPGWAVELLRHPNCTTTMLVRARKSIVYRKEMLMEERLRSGQTRGTQLRLVSSA